MTSLFFGKGWLINPSAPTLRPTGAYSGVGTPLAIAGYVAPTIRVPQLVDQEDAYQMLKNTVGIVEGLNLPNDCILKATFSYLPRGATIAEAQSAATLPAKGPYGIAGFPVIRAGLFADAWNATLVAGNSPWFYLGGGEIVGAEDGQVWTGDITLWRFIGITNANAIIA